MTIKQQYELVPLTEVKAGDQFIDRTTGRKVWTAETDCYPHRNGFAIDVRHTDGGLETRTWSSLSHRMMMSVHRG
jgi:hypothetical protein